MVNNVQMLMTKRADLKVIIVPVGEQYEVRTTGGGMLYTVEYTGSKASVDKFINKMVEASIYVWQSR